MIELNEMEKEFLDLFLTTWEADEQEFARKVLLENIESRGGIVRKEYDTDKWGIVHTLFFFKNGGISSYSPEMNKFVDAYPPTYTEVKE